MAWARVSTDAQQRRGLSIPQQLREIREYAQRQGFEIVSEHYEAASAFQDERKRVEFHRMLDMVRSTTSIGYILVHDYSRFSRDALEARVLVRELRNAGVEVVSLTDLPFDGESPTGVFLEAITFAKNEAYSREISFHTRKGHHANIQTRDPQTGWCYKNGGGPPWGYRPLAVQRGMRGSTPVMKRLWELDNTVVCGKPVHEWVRHCLVELAGRGATIRELCDFCTRTGIPRGRGGLWHRSIWRDLLNPVSLLQYSGYAVWGATAAKPWRLRPTEEWLIVEAAHPPVIAAEEAYTVAAVSRSPRRRGLYRSLNSPRSAPYLLSGGIFRCSRCGSPMVGLKQAAYICGTQAKSYTEVCQRSVYVSRTEVETHVVRGLQSLLRSLAEPADVIDRINGELAAAFCRTSTQIRISDTNRAESRGSSSSRRRAGPGSRGPDRDSDLVDCLMDPPHVDRSALQQQIAQATGMLTGGSRGPDKTLITAWVERVEVPEGSHQLVVRYRLPEGLTVPVGVGDWCRQHSRLLAAMSRRRWKLPESALIPAPGRPGRSRLGLLWHPDGSQDRRRGRSSQRRAAGPARKCREQRHGGQAP